MLNAAAVTAFKELATPRNAALLLSSAEIAILIGRVSAAIFLTHNLEVGEPFVKFRYRNLLNFFNRFV